MRLAASLGTWLVFGLASASLASAAKPLPGEYESVTPGGYVSLIVRAPLRDARRVGDILAYRRCSPSDPSSAEVFAGLDDRRVARSGAFSFKPARETTGRFSTRRRARGVTRGSTGPTYLTGGSSCPPAALLFTAERVRRRAVRDGEWRGSDALGQTLDFEVTRDGRKLGFFDTVASSPATFRYPCAGGRQPFPTPVLGAPIRADRGLSSIIPFPGGQTLFFTAAFSSAYRVSGTYRYVVPAIPSGAGPCDTGPIAWTASLEGAFGPGVREPPDTGDGDGDNDPVRYTYRAGQRIVVLRGDEEGSECTSAFALRKGDQLVGLTAGHCTRGRSGESVVQVLRNGDLRRQDFRRAVGQVLANSNAGEDIVDSQLDAAIFGLEGAARVSQTVQLSPRRRKVIRGVVANRDQVRGDRVCSTGRVTGTRCGKITGRDGFRQGVGEGRLTCTDFDVREGDSGGPVFTDNEGRQAAAVGIVVGSPRGSERMCFARIDDILKKFGASLPNGPQLR